MASFTSVDINSILSLLQDIKGQIEVMNNRLTVLELSVENQTSKIDDLHEEISGLYEILESDDECECEDENGCDCESDDECEDENGCDCESDDECEDENGYPNDYQSR